METYFFGLIFMLLCIWYSKNVIQKALILLDDNHKALLITIFQNENKYKGLITIIVLLVYFLSIMFLDIPITVLLLVLFVYLSIRVVFNYKEKLSKLKSNNFPQDYIKQFNIATIIQIVGILSLFISSLLLF